MKVIASSKRKITYVTMQKKAHVFSQKRPAGPKEGEKATSSVAPAIATMKMGLGNSPFDHERKTIREVG